MTPRPQPPPDLDDVHERADDLVCALTNHIGNGANVDHLLRRWVERTDMRTVTLVALWALRRTFADCMYTEETGTHRFPLTGHQRSAALREDTHP